MKEQDELAQHIITILLVDDHTMMREGTHRLLEEDPTLSVVGEARDGEEAIACCQQLKPAVVILDISMKGINGFSTARSLLKHPDPPAILVLTAYDQVAYVQTMLKLGAKGYWLKSARGSEIRQAVHEVVAGRRSLDPEIHQMLIDHQDTFSAHIEPLTTREIAVLQLIVQGARNTDIAQRLKIAVKTVETHLTSIYSKLGVQSRAEAIALAQQQGLLLESPQGSKWLFEGVDKT